MKKWLDEASNLCGHRNDEEPAEVAHNVTESSSSGSCSAGTASVNDATAFNNGATIASELSGDQSSAHSDLRQSALTVLHPTENASESTLISRFPASLVTSASTPSSVFNMGQCTSSELPEPPPHVDPSSTLEEPLGAAAVAFPHQQFALPAMSSSAGDLSHQTTCYAGGGSASTWTHHIHRRLPLVSLHSSLMTGQYSRQEDPVMEASGNGEGSIAACMSAGTESLCSCSSTFGYGRHGISSTSSIYGSTAPVVVSPPRCLPPTPSPPAIPTTPVFPSSTSGCGHWCSACRLKVQVEVECVSAEQRQSAALRRGLRQFNFPRRTRHKVKAPKKDPTGVSKKDLNSAPKKKKSPWGFRLNCRLRSNKGNSEPESSMPSAGIGCTSCVCPVYRRTESVSVSRHHHRSASCTGGNHVNVLGLQAPVIDLSRFNPEAYPIDDWDEIARQERAREMAEEIEPPAGFNSGAASNENFPVSQVHGLPALPLAYNSVFDLHILLERSLRLGLGGQGSVASAASDESIMHNVGRFHSCGALVHRAIHTQVDFVHHLVPDLLDITNCGFYWGKMDRYEAEKLLENKPEGTFLLRDSAQEDHLFSVSFRRYGRSLHARIEQWDSKFSFDSHDPGVYSSKTVCGLIEHYKDPSCCMFFEPLLTNPLHRTFPFPLQHLCRSTICSATTYDGINHLKLPKSLTNYLKEYHYKQKVRVRRYDQ